MSDSVEDDRLKVLQLCELVQCEIAAAVTRPEFREMPYITIGAMIEVVGSLMFFRVLADGDKALNTFTEILESLRRHIEAAKAPTNDGEQAPTVH